MKEIVKELPIIRTDCSNILNLYRFPNSSKGFNPLEVKYKPTSHFTELKIAFPTRCASALKLKNLNTENLSYRAFPAEGKSHFYARIEDNKVVLYRIQNTFLFQSYHHYYPFDYTPSKLKKAESREEFEHRMRSINFKLKNIELENFRVLGFEQGEFIPKNSSVIKIDSNAFKKNIKSINANFKELEETIKRTRIVNIKPLVDAFKDESAVKSTLFKMTERIEGRFILKNSFYERNLHDMRTKLLDLFKSKEFVVPSDVLFLKNEKWMLDEISQLDNGYYVLKGYRESYEFDSASIKAANLSSVHNLLKIHKILTIPQISNLLSLNEDVVYEMLQNSSDFFHLSNNSIALNDDSYILNSMFSLLVDKKSFEMNELKEKLTINNIRYEESELLDEIKKFCLYRAGRYYLKVHKDQ